MAKVYITDYFTEFGHEQEVLGNIISGFPDSDTEVIIVWHNPITEEVMDKFPKLKGIVRYGVGFDNVDIAAATKRGIMVCNNPDYGTDEVADTAIAMITGISRGIYDYDHRSRLFNDGTWQENVQTSIKRVNETTLGLIGAGRIGGNVAIKAKALRYDVVIYDPYQPRGHEKMLGTRRVDSMEELLAQSDIVSIHTPQTEETSGMVNEDFLSKMKEGASLVNVSRGGIVKDVDVFYEPLKQNHIQVVALDVLPQEPPKEGKLINAWRNREDWLGGRFIINPHSAYYSQSAYNELRTNAAKLAKMMLDGEQPFNLLNNVG